MINISHYQCVLTIRRNSQTEKYLVESCNPQYTQVYRVSHFNRTGIELIAFFILFEILARLVAFFSSNADRMRHCQNHITIKENSGQSILEYLLFK